MENEKVDRRIPSWVAIPIVLFIAGLIGFIFWMKGKDAAQPVVQNAVQEEKKTKSEEKVDTSAWKLYQNTAYGYELKYPANWEIGTTFGANPATFSAPSFSLPNCSTEGGICPNFSVGNVHEITAGETVKSDINFGPNDRMIAEKSMKISGEDASFVEYYQANYGHPDGQMGLVRQEMKVIHSGTLYRIYIDEKNPDMSKIKTSADWQYEKTFEAILASFKFIDRAVGVGYPAPIVAAEEVLYANQEFGFSVALPEGWENYKVSVQQDKGDDKHTYIYFLMPSTDKSAGYYDKGTGKIVPGFSEIFVIVATDLATWNKDANSKECLENPNPDCPDANDVLAKNGKYVFSASYGNGVIAPKDVQKFIEGTSAAKFLSGKFQLSD